METGQRIGKYVLRRLIGEGGMGQVWVADAEGERGFAKPVALKFLHDDVRGTPEHERMFVQEANIAAKLSHANLVSITDFGKVPGTEHLFIAMELVEGIDLAGLLRRLQEQRRTLPVGLALFIAGETLKGLRHLHERASQRTSLGLVHRDVSPSNIMVTYYGEVKLTDFGIAKSMTHMIAGSVDASAAGGFRGKPHYSAPEQIRGSKVDHRVDQFAVGVVLWEMLVGSRPFTGRSETEVLEKISRGMIEPTSGAFSSDVKAIVMRMLSTDPNRRYPDTKKALSAILAAPGYSADGTALGSLLITVFPEQAPDTFIAPLPSRPEVLDVPAARGRFHPGRLMPAKAKLATPDGADHPLPRTMKLPDEPVSGPAPSGPLAGTPALPHGRGSRSPKPAQADSSASVPATTSSQIRRRREIPRAAVMLGVGTAVIAGFGSYWLTSGAPPARVVALETRLDEPPRPSPGNAPKPPPSAEAAPEVSNGAVEPRAPVAQPSAPHPRKQRRQSVTPDKPRVSEADKAMVEARESRAAGNNIQALMLCRRAVKLGGGAPAWTLMGDVLAEIEEWDEARRAYEAALVIVPGYADAQRGYEKLRGRR